MPDNNKLFQNLGALMNMVRRVALEAGEITLKYYDDMDAACVQAKDDGSPVSLADQEAEAFIQKALEEITPGVPMIGEERADAGKNPDLAGHEYFWLVDALDGTREFVSGGDDFTVNIALIHKGDPVMGVVYVPVTGDLYAGHIFGDGTGKALKWNQDSGKEKSIRVRRPPNEGLTVVASMSHGSAEKLDKFLEGFKVRKVVKRGSSLKICIIAEGKADLYPRFGPTCEWDTAAAHAVLRAAGGFLMDCDGQALRYGGLRERYLNPEFIASSFSWFDAREDEG